MIAAIRAPESLARRTPASATFALDFTGKLLRTGQIIGGQKDLLAKLYRESLPQPAAPAALALGDGAQGLRDLFAKAKASALKYPAIKVMVEGEVLRISMAPDIKADGTPARNPGCLYIKDGDGAYLGKVDRAGAFQASRECTEAQRKAVAAFGADPAGVGARSGHLTGRCCFCSIKLKDARSTAVGYGSTCADHWGLPWGEAAPALIAAAA